MVVALKTLWQAAQVIPERNVAIGVNVKVRFFFVRTRSCVKE
jgi:hypothetical protein